MWPHAQLNNLPATCITCAEWLSSSKQTLWSCLFTSLSKATSQSVKMAPVIYEQLFATYFTSRLCVPWKHRAFNLLPMIRRGRLSYLFVFAQSNMVARFLICSFRGTVCLSSRASLLAAFHRKSPILSTLYASEAEYFFMMLAAFVMIHDHASSESAEAGCPHSTFPKITWRSLNRFSHPALALKLLPIPKTRA